MSHMYMCDVYIYVIYFKLHRCSNTYWSHVIVIQPVYVQCGAQASLTMSGLGLDVQPQSTRAQCGLATSHTSLNALQMCVTSRWFPSSSRSLRASWGSNPRSIDWGTVDYYGFLIIELSFTGSKRRGHLSTEFDDSLFVENGIFPHSTMGHHPFKFE